MTTRFCGAGTGKLLILALLLVLNTAALAQAAGTKNSPENAEAAADSLHDPLGRSTPQDTVMQFLEACHARQYAKAAHYLNLRKLSPAEREKQGPELAKHLEDLLDDTPFDIATLSRNPEGELEDGLPSSREHLLTAQAGGQKQELELERVDLGHGLKVWLVAAESIPLIPQAHQVLSETALEKRLPQELVTHEWLDTPLWRWLFLLISGLLIWIASALVAQGAAALGKHFTVLSHGHIQALWGPTRLMLAVIGFRAAMEFARPSAIVRLYLGRGLGLIFVLALAWASAEVIDVIGERWRARLDPRMRAMTYSVLPLGRQILKLLLFLFAILAVLASWGYNTNTLLAGLGVGGLAIALAAQKTIENLFGGISVIGDRPVLVGDFCRFGNRVGTITHIGLRSTRIRTLDRTIVSVPNSQFSTMELENFSARDKIWFHPTLKLRRDTNTKQLRQVVAYLYQILEQHPKVEIGDIPVRFIGIGDSSLDIEIFAYVLTANFDEYLGIQQDLLLDLMAAVERTGAALAVPVVEQVPRGQAAAA